MPAYNFRSLIRYIANWIFDGICRDPYNEFLLDVDDQFLCYRGMLEAICSISRGNFYLGLSFHMDCK